VADASGRKALWPEATDESFWPSDPQAKAAGVPFTHIMEGRKGEKCRELQVYDLEQRWLIDTEITRRTIEQSVKKYPLIAPGTPDPYRPPG
jgi:hypothetical protein